MAWKFLTKVSRKTLENSWFLIINKGEVGDWQFDCAIQDELDLDNPVAQETADKYRKFLIELLMMSMDFDSDLSLSSAVLVHFGDGRMGSTL